jgi:hypothetical protein
MTAAAEAGAGGGIGTTSDAGSTLAGVVDGVVGVVGDGSGESVVEGVVATGVGDDVDVVGDGVDEAAEAVVDTDGADPPPPPQADIVPTMLRMEVNRRVRLKLRFTVISRQR